MRVLATSGVLLGLLTSAQVAVGKPVVPVADTSAVPLIVPDEDPDAAAEKRSSLWEHTADPSKASYDTAMALVAPRLDEPSSLAALDAAIDQEPKRGEAYALRGWLRFSRGDFAGCASDLRRATNASPLSLSPTPWRDFEAGTLAHVLGMCLGRSEQRDAAEEVLRAEVEAGRATAATFVRLGETRLSLQRLDSAIDALEQSVLRSNSRIGTLGGWLLGLALERAGRPTESAEILVEAARVDRFISLIRAPAVPPIEPRDKEYLQAIAFAATGAPERALIHWRAYLADPDPMWRARAKNAEEASARLDLAALVNAFGTATFDGKKVAAPLFVELQRCLATLPMTVLRVEITKNGPPVAVEKPKPAKPKVARRKFFPPPKAPTGRTAARPSAQPVSTSFTISSSALALKPADAVVVRPYESLSGSVADINAATACAEAAARAFKLPTLGAGTWVSLSISVPPP